MLGIVFIAMLCVSSQWIFRTTLRWSEVLSSPSFYRWGSWNPKRLRNLPRSHTGGTAGTGGAGSNCHQLAMFRAGIICHSPRGLTGCSQRGTSGILWSNQKPSSLLWLRCQFPRLAQPLLGKTASSPGAGRMLRPGCRTRDSCFLSICTFPPRSSYRHLGW